jgi:hypothetical protein
VLHLTRDPLSRDLLEPDEQMSDLVLRNTADFDFPVLYDVDFGHTPEKVTLPVSALARVDPGRSGLAVVEPSVRAAAVEAGHNGLGSIATEEARCRVGI